VLFKNLWTKFKLAEAQNYAADNYDYSENTRVFQSGKVTLNEIENTKNMQSNSIEDLTLQSVNNSRERIKPT
jgi:hypothetical protein